MIYIVWSLGFFEIDKLLNNADRAVQLLSRMVIWQDMATWQYANIYKGIAQTIAMAFVGTLLGTIFALGWHSSQRGTQCRSALCAMPCAACWTCSAALTKLSGGLSSCALWAWPLAGVLAIWISDMGNLAKLYSEAIENIDRKQVEGVRATGADTGRIIRYGYLPQILPVFISLSLYSFESSTRSATILGLVGAGGIGMIIIERFRAGLFDQVAFVVLNVLVVIAIIDWGSGLNPHAYHTRAPGTKPATARVCPKASPGVDLGKR